MTLSELTRAQPRKKMYPFNSYPKSKGISTPKWQLSEAERIALAQRELYIAIKRNEPLRQNRWNNPYEGMYNYYQR